jgi:hypothetical protein
MRRSSLVITLLAMACGGESDQNLFEPPSGGIGGRTVAGAPSNVAGTNAGRAGAGGAAGSGGIASAGTAFGGGAGMAGASLAGSGGARAGGGGAAAGRGGTNAAGRGGSSAAGTGGKTPCDTLLANADRLLPAAQSCDNSLNRSPCTGFIEDECGCKMAVDMPSSPAARAYHDAIATALSQCLVNCSAVVCPAPISATCMTTGSSTMGTCVAD